MRIESIVCPEHIEEKLQVKHGVTRYEAEQCDRRFVGWVDERKPNILQTQASIIYGRNVLSITIKSVGLRSLNRPTKFLRVIAFFKIKRAIAVLFFLEMRSLFLGFMIECDRFAVIYD